MVGTDTGYVIASVCTMTEGTIVDRFDFLGLNYKKKILLQENAEIQRSDFAPKNYE